MTIPISEVIKKARDDVRANRKADPNFALSDTIRRGTDGLYCDPYCDVCQGIGLFKVDVPVRHPQFGKLQPCPNRDLLSGIDTKTKFGLDRHEIATYNWGQIIDNDQALFAAKIVQDTLERGYGWVYLWGGHGKAKSLILRIAVAQALQKREQAAYARMTNILDNMREAFDADYPNQESVFRLNFWATIPLLCIDEFDRIHKTAYVSEKTFSMMDKRYEAAIHKKSITLIASNKAPNQLGEGYLADRIEDGRFQVVELPGDSLRPAMKRAKQN